jgi:putative lipoprotein (rSAM/lipoprotein system)
MVPMYGVVPKYGMPVYEINGIVTDKETSNPIQNIQIVRQVTSEYGDTVYTNIDGKYTFHSDLSNFYLKVKDIDGEENGGDFATQEVNVKFTKNEYAKTVNIELEKKK